MTDMSEIVVERDLMVPAGDGVMLATDIYRPASPGAVPGAPRTHTLRRIGGEPIGAHRAIARLRSRGPRTVTLAAVLIGTTWPRLTK
jgi:predicted acyl esterase